MTTAEMIAGLIMQDYEVSADAGGIVVGRNSDVDFYVSWLRIGTIHGGGQAYPTATEAASAFLTMAGKRRAEYEAGGSMGID